MHISIGRGHIAFGYRLDHGFSMSEKINMILARVVAKAPQWLRHDLTSKDVTVRDRAEETLAAMIADALEQEGINDSGTDTAAA